MHNRLESDHQPGTWIYNANNELQSYGTGVERRVLSYDANGSTVREELGDPAFQVTDYVYDPQDRLIEVKRDGVTQVEYAYDPYGQRIWRETKPATVEGASITWFLYSTEGLIGEYRADGSLIREYGWLPNGLWGTDPVWQHDATGTHVMHNDHLFTPERMTRVGESVVSWAGNREAFGRVAVQPGSSTTMLLRFPGQWEDGVGGFYQNWWREYITTWGRYSSYDPIGLDGGINFYSYGNLSPLIYIDETGESASLAREVIKRLLREAAKREARKEARKIAECDAIHKSYYRVNCGKCTNPPCTPEEAHQRCLCLSAEIAARTLYLQKKCDHILPGSKTRGSKVAEDGHKQQVHEKTVVMLACCKRAYE